MADYDPKRPRRSAESDESPAPVDALIDLAAAEARSEPEPSASASSAVGEPPDTGVQSDQVAVPQPDRAAVPEADSPPDPGKSGSGDRMAAGSPQAGSGVGPGGVDPRSGQRRALATAALFVAAVLVIILLLRRRRG